MYNIVESGKRIAGLRKNAGYTQEQFGEKIGLSYRSIADIERGYRGTSIDTLVDISNLLNVSLDYLVLGVEKHGEKGDKHVLEVVRGLSEEKKLFAAKILSDVVSLCRSSRKKWNVAMLQYIIIQAFLYVASIATVSVAASFLCGFWGNIWSSPVYNLAMDNRNHLGVKYNISFPWVNVMQAMTVPQAFMITFVFLFLYLILIGFLLYVCNLLLKEIYGILIVFGIQISGYLLQQEGFTYLSLMAKAIPGYAIDGNGGQWEVVLLFWAIILILVLISLWLIGWVDFKDAMEEE